MNYLHCLFCLHCLQAYKTFNALDALTTFTDSTAVTASTTFTAFTAFKNTVCTLAHMPTYMHCYMCRAMKILLEKDASVSRLRLH